MDKHRRIVLTGLTATLAAVAVLGGIVATASGSRIKFTSQGFRITWTSLEFEAGLGVPCRCPLTLEGSFHSRTLSKVLEQLSGYVTRAMIGASGVCTGGTAKIMSESLPWHVRDDGFSGTLPSIREIHLRMIGVEYLINQNIPLIGRADCQFRSTVASPMEGWVQLETGVATRFVPSSSARIPLLTRLVESVVGCPVQISLRENAGSPTVLGGTTGITVTLIQ